MYPSLIFFSKPDRHTDTYSCITVAPDTLHIPGKFQSRGPTQLKATLTLSNSTDYPLSAQNAPLVTNSLAIPSISFAIPVCKH